MDSTTLLIVLSITSIALISLTVAIIALDSK